MQLTLGNCLPFSKMGREDLIERCGKINASNSGSESWTGIGVVAGCGAVVLIRQGPHGKQGDRRWRIRLLQTPQELSLIDKTRNQLRGSKGVYLAIWEMKPTIPTSSCRRQSSRLSGSPRLLERGAMGGS